ncbi:MAG: pyridoxine 5'-phosphate synthase [Verrucomicrobia bacterium]|nr:pyridoxine 5'-phosphate synthase [Verrucomicrobiota bacterium]
MIRLGVNIDHVATLRQARYRNHAAPSAPEPDPLIAARVCLAAGAHSLTVHLREDRRHIQDEDVLRVAREFRDRLNLEMAATPAMLDFALRLKPSEVCLVPENRAEVTTEGGLDVAEKEKLLGPVVQKLREAGILVSLFIDPDPRQVDASAAIRAPVIELHTGRFADAAPATRQRELTRLEKAAQQAHHHKVQVNAGHGLRLSNLPELLRVPHLHTLNIGHSLVSHALIVGLDRSVRDFLEAIAEQ